MKHIVFLGGPGSGKGTQSNTLSKELSLPKLSTGDLIRDTIKQGTGLADELMAYTSSGKLVPDSLVINLFKEFVSSSGQSGFISDGFPRTVEQAKALDCIFEENGATPFYIYLDVPKETAVSRTLTRTVCTNCSAVYGKLSKPKQSNVCDQCGASLSVRDDDGEAIIEERYKVFMNEMNPLFDYYGDRLLKIDSTKPPEEVYQDVLRSVSDIAVN